MGVKRNKKRMCVIVCVLLCCLCGCKKAGNPAEPSGTITESPDWTAAFGGQTAPEKEAGMTPKPTKGAGKIPQPTKTLEEQIAEIVAKQGYPTVVPLREFVPEEGQTELVLWGRSWLDDYMVAELNRILQERKYSFYLTVKREPERVSLKPELSRWQEIFDAGETVDLIAFFDWDSILSGKTYGKTSAERMIMGGYLLPFSEYPDTPAKERLRAAYGEEYWRLCSFGGEIYGVSNTLLNDAGGKIYLLLNLDAAEQAGIEIPEKLDVLQLDELLGKAAAAGIPGILLNSGEIQTFCQMTALTCCLYAKCLPDGGYSFVNPFEDRELIELCDAMNRYRENGWFANTIEENPLVLYVESHGDNCFVEDNQFVQKIYGGIDKEGTSVNVKVYEEKNSVMQEGSYFVDLLGIASASRHKEEALELLCLMHTDEEIVQLLRYGLEGIHYRLKEDGLEEEVKTTKVYVTSTNGVDKVEAYGVETRRIPGKFAGNPKMPLEFDKTAGMWHRNAAGYYGDIREVILIPYPEELLAGKEEQMEKIRNVLYVSPGGYLNKYSIEMLWWQKKTDYEQELEKMRTALAEAGYNELIAELNQKLEEQKKESK